MKNYFLLLLLIPIVSFSQYEKEIDSLNKIINSKVDVVKKGEAYYELLLIYNNLDLNKSKEISKKLYQLAKNNACPKCEVLADYSQAELSTITGDDKNAIIFYEKSAQKALKLKDYEQYQGGKLHKIQSQINLHLYDEAKKEIDDLFAFKKKNNLDDFWHYFYYIKGAYNFDKGYYTTAIDNFVEADKYCKFDSIDGTAMSITCLNRISLVYGQLKNYKKAVDYNEKALSIATKENNLYYIMYFSLQRGVLECELNNYNKALPYLTKAYKHYSSLGRDMFTSSSALFLGRAYLGLKNYTEAKKYNEIAINEYLKQNDNQYLGRCYVTKTKIDLGINDINLAKQDLEKAKKYMKSFKNDPIYLEITTCEIDYYKATKDINNLLKSIDTRDSMRLEISKKTNLNNLTEIETKYQTEKKEQQIKLLSTQNELAQKQKYIYIGLLGLLALIGGSLFYGYRNKIKTAQKLNELNELKSRFFANISHEFRTPLTLIKSPVQSLQSKLSNDDHLKELKLIETNATRMLQLVDQLLELSKIDSGNLKLILKDGNIGSFLTSIIEPFQFQSKEKGIQFTSNIQKTNENNAFDKDVIEKIVTNLVSNAFKYSPENEQITFSSSIENSNLKLVVSNTGSDIKKEDLPKLFERFYQKNDTQQGVGIGLALVKELVDLYRGTIITSVENGKLSFVVNLTLSLTNENAVVIPSHKTTSTIKNTTTIETELPILLIVDDNADIRMILKDIFKNDYQILEAQDGKEGLQIAQNQIPDCIISDVMMPKMDGFEFTKQIKNNELTSFVPVILLTAKTSDEAHLEGLKSTADAFLTKPFNNEIVKATVQRLIAERKKLHGRYSQELVLKPVDIVINSQEEKFIERLQNILDKNLFNSEYIAEDFASEIGMSRMQLHRKLKSLLGVSATEFLRNERLKVGAELLQKGNGNISEIAYSIGFSDVSYFSKCFKEMYQCTPTEYMEK